MFQGNKRNYFEIIFFYYLKIYKNLKLTNYEEEVVLTAVLIS